MFDPLFAVLFLLVVAAPIAVVAFWISQKRLTLGAAIWMAFLVPFSGLVGFFTCVMIVTGAGPFFGFELRPLLRVAMCAACGGLLAFLMGWVHWKTARRKIARG